jgi:citrate lyase subunit beta/citryl-CoA lyase
MGRARRSVHFVPGGQERFLARALGSAADALVLDLEDAVLLADKAAARATVTAWLRERDFGGRERIVRINPLDSGLGEADLEATLAAGPDAYMIPKVRGPADLERVDALLLALERAAGRPERSTGLIAIATETPEGVLAIREIARAPRVSALTWGGEDLSAALGARRNRDAAGEYLDVFRYARIATLLAASAAGIDALDSVYVDFRDLEGLRREAEAAADTGFAGKLTIHPDQIPIVNAAFTPTDDEVRAAEELLAAAERAGKGAFEYRGQMIDVPHLVRARRLLERRGQARIVPSPSTR